MYEVFLEECERPQYQYLAAAYEDYRANSRPCMRGAPNQCAVRMSIALGRSGFGLESFRPRDRVHSGNGNCQTNGLKHVLGANELARWLTDSLADPVIIRPQGGAQGCAHAAQELSGRKGIIYFNNCFAREPGGPQVGDHIDLFTGTQYYNQIIHPQAGGDETTGGSLFGRADQVWFWTL